MTLASTVVWEVRTTGDDTNGGGFNSASSGTDYSQQNTPVLTVTDAATSGVGSTTLTSATGGFTAAMVGNVVHLYSGTNLTEGWYEITGYTDGNTVTLDRAPDDGAGGVSGATCKVGGALGSPGGLGAALANAAVSGHIAWIAGGTYTLTTTTANTSGGPIATPASIALRLEGYNTTRGDRGSPPVISAGTITSVTLVKMGGERYRNPGFCVNLAADGNNQSGVYGFDITSANPSVCFFLCEAYNCVVGFPRQRYAITRVRCKAYNNSSYGFAACSNLFCEAYNNGSDGFYGGSDDQAVQWHHCLARNNGGDGFNEGNAYRIVISSCTAYANSGNGFSCAGRDMLKVMNCLAVNNAGYGYADTAGMTLINCAGYNNTSGNVQSGNYWNDGFITLTGDPFIDAANGDFRLNNTAGAGAVLRGAGLGVYGQTDNQDVGAVQHSDPAGGGGGTTVITQRRRVFLGADFRKSLRPVIAAGGAPPVTEYVPIPCVLRRLIVQQHYRRRPGTVVSTTTPSQTQIVPVRTRGRTHERRTQGRTRAVIVPTISTQLVPTPVIHRRRHIVRQQYAMTRRAVSHQHSTTVNQTVVVSSPRKVR